MKITKYFGLLGIAIEYIGLLFLIEFSKHDLNINQTVSYYGTLSATRLVFSITFTLAALTFGLFCYWIYKQYRTGWVYLTALIIAVLAQIGLSWFPDGGASAGAHEICALIVMMAMPVIVLEFSRTQVKRIRNFCYTIIVLELAAIPFVLVGDSFGGSLLAEALTVIMFQLWVLIATFTKVPIV